MEIIQTLQVAQNAAAQTVFGAPRMAQVTLLLWRLHWLPVCFLVQFKVLVIMFKALYGTGPWVPERLSHPNGIGLPCTHAWQNGHGVGLLIKEFWLVRSRRKAISALAPIFWNIIPTLLLVFCRANWPDGGVSYWRWLMHREMILPPTCLYLSPSSAAIFLTLIFIILIFLMFYIVGFIYWKSPWSCLQERWAAY